MTLEYTRAVHSFPGSSISIFMSPRAVLAAIAVLAIWIPQVWAMPSNELSVATSQIELKIINAAWTPARQVVNPSLRRRRETRLFGRSQSALAVVLSVLAAIFLVIECLRVTQIDLSARWSLTERSLATGGRDACTPGEDQQQDSSDDGDLSGEEMLAVASAQMSRLECNDIFDLLLPEYEEIKRARQVLRKMTSAISECGKWLRTGKAVYKEYEGDLYSKVFHLAPNFCLTPGLRRYRDALATKKEKLSKLIQTHKQHLQYLKSIGWSNRQEALELLVEIRFQLQRRVVSRTAVVATAAAKTALSGFSGYPLDVSTEESNAIVSRVDRLVSEMASLSASYRSEPTSATGHASWTARNMAVAETAERAGKLASQLRVLQMYVQAGRLGASMRELEEAAFSMGYTAPVPVDESASPSRSGAAAHKESEAVDSSASFEDLATTTFERLGALCMDMIRIVEGSKDSNEDPFKLSAMISGAAVLVSRAQRIKIPENADPVTVERLHLATHATQMYLEAFKQWANKPPE